MNTSDLSTTVLLTCGECGEGRYSAGLGGGTCETCGHAVVWADILPTLDPGESPAVVSDPLAPNGLWLAYRLADDTRGE